MEYTPVIDRSNFKEMRNKYRITLDDIRNACGISHDTIIRFERNDPSYTNAYNVKPENGKVLIKTLNELISHKLSGDLVYENERENNKIVYNHLREYCKRNNISLKEFCIMCDIDITTLSSKHIGAGSINKVCVATGWTRKDIISGKIFDKTFVKKEANMSYVGTEKSMRALGLSKEEVNYMSNDVKVTRAAAIASDIQQTNTEKQYNVRYIAKDGYYYKQYEVMRSVSDRITKEQFIEAINKMEG